MIDVFEFRNEEGGPVGRQVFAVDWSTGHMRGYCVGFLTSKTATAHFKQWADTVRDLHRRHLPVRILVDLRQASAQSQEVADLIDRAVADIYRSRDRIAMVVPHAILRMQMRRVTDMNHKFFDALDPAEAWLGDATF